MTFNFEAFSTLLLNRDITASQLSKETGICKVTLYRLLNKKTTTPRFDTIESLADYFKVNMETFVVRS